MIRINLLATREFAHASTQRAEVVLLGSLVVAALLIAVFVNWAQNRQLSGIDGEIDALRQSVHDIQKDHEDLQQLIGKQELLEEKLSVVRSLIFPARRMAAVRTLEGLSASAPDLLWLLDFTETNGLAKIQGESVDNQTIASFAHNLEQSPYFENVEIRETVQDTLAATGPSRRRRRRRAVVQDTSDVPTIKRFLLEASLPYGRPATSDAQGEEE